MASIDIITKNKILIDVKTYQKFSRSYRFDVPSIRYEGRYYFLNDIELVTMRNGTEKLGIQVVYNDGKLRQDTFYVTPEFVNELIEFNVQ